MTQFKKKNEQKLWHSPIALVVIFCLLILFVYNMIGLIQKDIETNRKKNLQLETINTLTARQAELSTNISKLSTDEGIEESIRDKYQVAKPGEGVVTIVDEQPPTPSPAPPAQNSGFWTWLKNFFHL